MSRDIVQLLPELFALCGQEIGVSDWKLIDQNSIDKFSALTGDAGPIHNDQRYPSRSLLLGVLSCRAL